MMEETLSGTVRSSDRLDSDSPLHVDQDTDLVRGEDCRPTSPNPPSQADLSHDRVAGSAESDGFRSDDPDHGQFYAHNQTFMPPAAGPETQFDDLPLVFSLPNSVDDICKVYSCNICNFKTAFKNSLVNHQAVHSDARPWVCEICDYAAKRKQDLKKHLQTMHGMIIDSLSLRPGTKPVTSSCVSSSGFSSPTDIKPVLVNSDQCGSGKLGYMSNVMNCTSVSAHQASGFKQPVYSSTKTNTTSHALPAPDVAHSSGEPFTQLWGEHKSSTRMPASSTETFMNRFRFGLREDLDSNRNSGFDNFLLQKLNWYKEDEHKHSSAGKASLKSSRTENKDDGRLPSVSEVLPKYRSNSVSEEHSSINHNIFERPTHSDQVTHEGITKSEVFAACMKKSPRAVAPSQGSVHRLKRVSLDSTSDPVCVKTPRFQSPGSDTEHCPQVTSQSDHTGNSELISSTVSHSRSLETKKSFHCAHCDILFFESAMYLMHMGLHDSSNPWKCSVCARTFFEKYSFTSHFINQH